MDIPQQQHVNIDLPTPAASLLSRAMMSPATAMSKSNHNLVGPKLPLAVHPLIRSETALLQTIGLGNLARNLPASVTAALPKPVVTPILTGTSGPDKKIAFKKLSSQAKHTLQRYSYKPVTVIQPKTIRPLRPLPPPPSLVSLEQFQRMKVNLSKS